MSDDHELLFSGQPRYQAVAQALVREIQSGHYPEGSMLPTESELCDRFSVSRHTVREAIRRLKDVGLVSRRPGVGTRVISTRIGSRYIHSSDSIRDLMQYVRDVRLEIQTVETIALDEALADFLEAPVGAEWTHIYGLRYLAGEEAPIAKADVYLPPQYHLTYDDLANGHRPIYTVLEERYHLKVVRVDQKISAVILNEDEARTLGVDRNSAGLKVVRTYYAEDDELLQVAVSLHHGDRFTYSVSQHLEIQQPGRTR